MSVAQFSTKYHCNFKNKFTRQTNSQAKIVLKMANSLFISTSSLSCFHSSHYRQVSGATTLSKLIGYSNFDQRGINQSCRNNIFTVSSLFGRKAPVKTKRETIVPDPDYRIPIVLLGAAGGLVYSENLIAAVPVGLLGLLLLVQATRVRFVFDDEALEVKVGSQLQESGENVFVGGKNRWKYSTFVNWEFWWPNFPILVYFKETQTKPEGQIHFFPIIFNGKQLYDVMVERAGTSKTSGPK